MPRIRRLRPSAPSTLRPTATLTLLAALLAVAAALVGHRSGQETARLVEARGRLALVLAAQTDARLGALRAALAGAVAPLAEGSRPDGPQMPQPPDGPDGLGTLNAALRDADPAFAGLALEQPPAPGALENTTAPGPDGATHLALHQPLAGSGARLTLLVDPLALAEGADQPPGLALFFATRDGTLVAASGAGRDDASGDTGRTLRALAAEARAAGALAQRELDGPKGSGLLAVAAPLRDEPLVLLLLVPAPRDHGAPVGMTAILLALAGTALAVLPLLRKKRRQP